MNEHYDQKPFIFLGILSLSLFLQVTSFFFFILFYNHYVKAINRVTTSFGVIVLRTVQYRTVQYNAVQYNTVQYCTVTVWTSGPEGPAADIRAGRAGEVGQADSGAGQVWVRQGGGQHHSLLLPPSGPLQVSVLVILRGVFKKGWVKKGFYFEYLP